MRKDLNVLNSVQLRFQLKGVTTEQGAMLIDRFKGRRPLYGSDAVATPDVKAEVSTEQ